MSDDTRANGSDGPAAWVIALIVVAAIVLLVLLARGPEDQERSAAPLAVAAVAARA